MPPKIEMSTSVSIWNAVTRILDSKGARLLKDEREADFMPCATLILIDGLRTAEVVANVCCEPVTAVTADSPIGQRHAPLAINAGQSLYA